MRILRAQTWRLAQVNFAILKIKGSFLQNCHPERSRETYFLAVFVTPHAVWYIIPLDVIVPRGSICLFPQHPHSQGHFEPYREAWDLLAKAEAERTMNTARL